MCAAVTFWAHEVPLTLFSNLCQYWLQQLTLSLCVNTGNFEIFTYKVYIKPNTFKKKNKQATNKRLI